MCFKNTFCNKIKRKNTKQTWRRAMPYKSFIDQASSRLLDFGLVLILCFYGPNDFYMVLKNTKRELG